MKKSKRMLFLVASPEVFKTEREKNRRKEFLTPFTVEELSEMKLFLSADKQTGYALTVQGELTNAFNNGPKGEGRGEAAIIHAIRNGANKLSCIGDFLSRYYATFGFNEYKREKWDDRYAPDNWDYSNYGTPDIIYMRMGDD